MEKLVEGLELVEEVNRLVENLQESLELFERGKDDKAIAKINSVEEGIEDLTVGELPERAEIEEKLSDALGNLEWVTDNADRVKGKKVD
ncbi:MAG: hypothetical protein V5A87_00070 [Candidatus Bipolaricaulota bacterium]|nr:hypothetical protein [Candidatus Bipolaricaulota bacterium]MBS3791949.1 hypothetical protein [Candidatus Bipolaricaulota bacterium]